MQNIDEILNDIVPLKIKDKDGVVTYINKAFEDLKGFVKTDILGSKEKIGDTQKCSKKEYEIKKADGSIQWIQNITTPLSNKNGDFIGEISVYSDITEKKIFEKLSIVDSLTSLYNRRYFNEQLKRMIQEFKREKKLLCFAILDVDNFKKYNDSYGHQAGDDVLKAVGKTLLESLHRGNDYAFRLGGEEFGLLFEALDKKNAYSFVDGIRKTIEELNIEHALNLDYKVITASFGLVTVDFIYEDIDDNGLYSMADHSLYAAKDNGRNCVVLHGSDNDDEDDLEFF
jgi:diguanylate cyclase (GGDEF)-like protein